MNQGDIQTFYPSTPGLGLNSHVEEFGFNSGCGLKPARINPKYNPIVKIPKIYGPLKGCGIKPSRITYGPPFIRTKKNAKDYDSDTGRFDDDMGKWHKCREESTNKFLSVVSFSLLALLNASIQNEDAYDAATHRWNDDMGAWYACKAAANEPVDDTAPDAAPDAAAKAKTDAENKAKWEAATKSAYAGLSCDDMKKTYGITSKSWGSASDAAVGEFSGRCTVSGSSPRGRANIPGSGPDDSGVDQKAKNTKWIIIGVVAVVVIIVIAVVVRMMRNKGK